VILEAHDAGCELVVFPEMSLNGYLAPTVYDDRVATLDSPQMLELIKFGASRSVEWLFGIVERAPVSKPYIM
jgi:predicted amidohydrolase